MSRPVLLGAMAALVVAIVGLLWAGTTRECDDVGSAGLSVRLDEYSHSAQVRSADLCIQDACRQMPVAADTTWLQTPLPAVSADSTMVSITLRSADGSVLAQQALDAEVQRPPTGSRLGSSSCGSQAQISLYLTADGQLRNLELVEG